MVSTVLHCFPVTSFKCLDELHVDSAQVLGYAENELKGMCPDLNSTVMIDKAHDLPLYLTTT